MIIRPGWDAPHVRCFLRTFCAWPCLLRQVGTVLGSPYDYVVARLAYANPGSRHLFLGTTKRFPKNTVPLLSMEKHLATPLAMFSLIRRTPSARLWATMI